MNRDAVSLIRILFTVLWFVYLAIDGGVGLLPDKTFCSAVFLSRSNGNTELRIVRDFFPFRSSQINISSAVCFTLTNLGLTNVTKTQAVELGEPAGTLVRRRKAAISTNYR